MNGRTYPYLELAAVPEVGAALLDPRPAFVFRGDGTAILWTNAAGAGVFASGTMGWACALTGSCTTVTDRKATSAAVERITANLLDAFARPHAGAVHPSKPNISRFWLPTTVTSGAA